jgi:hypothetical protein
MVLKFEKKSYYTMRARVHSYHNKIETEKVSLSPLAYHDVVATTCLIKVHTFPVIRQ